MRGTTNTGSAPGRKNAPVTQPCAYEASPKLGICRSTPSQVLEIGGGRKEEDVYALCLELLGQVSPSVGVVEHRAESIGSS